MNNILIHALSAPMAMRQTGLTTIGVAMVNGFTDRNYKSMFVAKDLRQLDWTVKSRHLNTERGIASTSLSVRPFPAGVSLAVIDDCSSYSYSELSNLIRAVKHSMVRIPASCSIILLDCPEHLVPMLYGVL